MKTVFVEAVLSGTDERSGEMDNADPELEISTLSQLAIYFEGRLNAMTL